MSERSLRDLDGNELGFTIPIPSIEEGGEDRDIKFWNCDPRLYLISQPTFDHARQADYLREIHEFDESNVEELYENGRNQFTGEPAENLFESGARDCYLSYGVGRSHGSHITNLRTVGHGSVFEHGMISLKVACVSRGFTHELIRHRVGVAYSQVSTRYVDAWKLGFVVPPLIRTMRDTDPFGYHAYVDSCMASLGEYEALIERVTRQLKIAHPDMSAINLRKKARGSARAALPIGLAQVLQFSLNLRIARHILNMRGSLGAEEEIRYFSEALVPVAKEVWPVAMSDVSVTAPGVELEDGTF